MEEICSGAEACAEFNFLPSDFRTSTFEATQCLSMRPMQQ